MLVSASGNSMVDGEGRAISRYRVEIHQASGPKCVLDALTSNIPEVWPGMNRQRLTITVSAYGNEGSLEVFDREVEQHNI